MGEFMRDPSDWLRRLSPDEWIRAGLGELRRAETSFGRGDARAGTAGVKRAAGMALNAVLLFEPKESWGRTYVDHVGALAADRDVPEAVRAACRTLLAAGGTAPGVVNLRTPRADERVLEAARDVIAHAWAVAKKHEQTNG